MTTKTVKQTQIKMASAKDLKRQAEAAHKAAPILKTEKDGRLYAIAMLEALGDETRDTGFPVYSALAETVQSDEDPGLIMVWRKGPQTETLKRWFSELYQFGTPQAIAGFFVVWTEYVGSNLDGGDIDPEGLAHMEKAGEFDQAGSVLYRDAKAASEALAKGEIEYRIAPPPTKRQAEKVKVQKDREYRAVMEAADKARQPNTRLIDRDQPEAVEEFLRRSGQTRRAAIALLTIPYEESAQSAKTDKQAAEAFAAVAASLEEVTGGYFLICSHLEQAERNMKAAVRARKDGEKLLTLARRELVKGRK